MPTENRKGSSQKELFLSCIKKLAEVHEPRDTHAGLKCSPRSFLLTGPKAAETSKM